ncbi:pep-cterm sorting domain-containing protein [Anaeramoeba ignava]|uniref:Pep-cterm sorting domain-containing protein n=1 Tax=Anaeramoeba ignava TaxID=1746090 RepID=A0A9Q0R5V0_ANAIG|nr:pep-cterm sorting domain-containing protein [Anaeramoeba ignava]
MDNNDNNNQIENANQNENENEINKRLKGKKEKEKEKEKGIEKKRLFHSFFSLFDKDSISKQDFDKLKQFQIFLPNSFLVDIQTQVIQDNQKEVENKDKEVEKKEKEIDKKEKENQQMKIEIEEKWKKEVEKMKPTFDKYGDQYQKDLEFEKKLKLIKKNFPQFSNSKIITEEEYIKKLQEWINDNDFFFKMKKRYSAKRNGFSARKWHKAVDGKGKTLVIIKTKQNFIFGGFTQVGWTTDKSKWNEKNLKKNYGWINDKNAFIFSLRNDKGDRKPEKFTIKKGQEQYAIFYNYKDRGPTFGGFGFSGDVSIASTLQCRRTNFGGRYNLPDGITYNTDEAKSYLAGSHSSWVVDELETYFI